ncbi:hypothetical protein LPB72_09670 [Hydrogenophaga crassostreae]|uniref:DUF1468 domain-containing protein n=1 Tax=Hydrogenophaga crassostreae TaxID=1763535 RepID=A0A167HQE2_9BURK|nr:tripartite tricarboxylate transporter TctB family protein [Hydrogenophaga crassostreae]AOW13312.1 hypothetical protein LPB072_11055 [Hydrogenophaga crassostreae]OAD41593.1 hypothetical protein LPB72_09670 [Hydrogenophaga crassostreae]
MALKNSQDFYSGLLFCIVGGAFAWGATSYDVGTAAQMGPGYFPLMLGLLLVALGVAITVKAFGGLHAQAQVIGPWAWRPLLCILLANVLFGILLVGLPSVGLPAMGMWVAIIVMTVVASMARKGFSFKESVVQGVILSMGSYLVFVLGLNLQFPVWPAFLYG